MLLRETAIGNCAHSAVAETDEMATAPTQVADDVRKDMANSRSSIMLQLFLQLLYHPFHGWAFRVGQNRKAQAGHQSEHFLVV